MYTHKISFKYPNIDIFVDGWVSSKS